MQKKIITLIANLRIILSSVFDSKLFGYGSCGSDESANFEKHLQKNRQHHSLLMIVPQSNVFSYC